MTMRHRLLCLLLILGLPAFAWAQASTNIRATDSSSGATTQVGDNTNHALRVNIVAGTSAATQSGVWSFRLQDGSGNLITSRVAGASRPLEFVQLDGSGNIVTPSAGTGTSSNFTSGFPASGTASGGSDGTNMQAFRMFDIDTGGGTQYAQGVNLRISAGGGSIEAKGAQTSANSLPVVLASDQAAIGATQSGAWSFRAQDGAGNLLTSATRGSERALTVQIVDGSGAQVTSFGGAGGTSSNYGSAFPSAGTALGYNDGTNMQGARVVDLDTSGGTFYGLATNLVKRTAGTPTELIGQAAMASSLPVVIASDQTSFPVTLASITSSVVPGTGATNLGKAEDAVHTTGDTGVMALGIRRDTAAASSGTTGDYEPFSTDANGRLWTNPFPASPAAATYLPVRLTDSSGFLDTPFYTHDGALTPASTKGAMAMLRASAAAPSNVSAGDDAVLPWGLLNGSQVVNLASGGTLITGTGSSLNINCTAGCSGGTQYAEDAAGASGDTGTIALAQRNDTPGTLAGTSGDYATLQLDANGALRTMIMTSAGVAANIATDATADAAANTTGPQLMAYGSSTAPTAMSTNGDATPLWTDLNGRLQPNISQINGIAPLMGNGVTGTGSLRVTVASDNSAVAGMGVGATAAAPPANANYIAGITSGATGGLLSGGIPVCDSTGWLDMSSATTTEIAPLVASRTIHVCSIVAMAGGTTTVTLKRGTGTNCGTGTTAVSPGFELTAQTGWVEGTGFGEIYGAAGAGTVGGAMTSGNALCVTSSAGVNLHVKVRYAVY